MSAKGLWLEVKDASSGLDHHSPVVYSMTVILTHDYVVLRLCTENDPVPATERAITMRQQTDNTCLMSSVTDDVRYDTHTHT